MPETVLSEPRRNGDRVEAHLRVGRRNVKLYVESRDAALLPSSDAFLIASLLSAMHACSTFVVEGPVSPRLFSRLTEIQSIFEQWLPHLRTVPVRVETAAVEERSSGVGAFFSLGVDSFFTLMKNRKELTHLVVVEGFDLLRLDPHVWAEIAGNARRVAAETGVALIHVASNFRELEPPGVDWRWCHGPALAAVAHVLSGSLGKVYVSASQTAAPLGPWGSHPLVDPLWNTEVLDFVHYGSLSRVAKLVQISDEPLVLETLRVCQGSRDEYNCGRCAKCVLVMTVLESLGRLERSNTLPHAIPPSLIEDLNMIGPVSGTRIHYFEEALDLLREHQGPRELVDVIEKKLRRAQLRLALRDIRATSGRLAKQVRRRRS